MQKEFLFFIIVGIIFFGGIIMYFNSNSQIKADNENEEIITINNEDNQTLNLLKMEIK